MDLNTLVLVISIVAGIITIAGFLYVAFIGQKSIPEWLSERKGKAGSAGIENSSPPFFQARQPKVLNNLPPRGEFVGREKEKAQVREALASRSYLVTIDGIGGIGKTSLAIQVAHEYLGSRDEKGAKENALSFDALIWVTAKDRELTFNELLDTIARTLGYVGIAQFPLQQKCEEVKRLLRVIRCLVIVDNFETVKDEALRDFLLELPEPSKGLITSREQKLREARAISLRGMERTEALKLMRGECKRLGLVQVAQAEDRLLTRLYEATGGAPLAMKWAIGQIKQRGQSLDTVLNSLHRAKGDLFENIFARSWELLSESAKCVLKVMPIFANSASKVAIEAASQIHKWDLDEAMGQLVEMWLVEEITGELEEERRRYSVHPLTRSFASAKSAEDVAFENDSHFRAAHYYLEAARSYGDWGNIEGFEWFEVELANIFALIEWCHGAREWRIVVELTRQLIYFLGTRGYWQERLYYGQMAIAASEQLGDKFYAAWMHAFALGWIYLNQGNFVEAEHHSRIGKVLFEELGRWKEVCEAMRNEGKIARGRGQSELARGIIQEALKIARTHGFESQVYGLTSDLGDLALQSGEYDEANRLYSEALIGFERRGRGERIGSRLIDLGNVAQKRGELAKARKFFEQGLEQSEKSRRQDNIAFAKIGLARLAEVEGRQEEAARLGREASQIFLRLGMNHELEQARKLVQRCELEDLKAVPT